jgi:hypothetical protein
MTEIRTDKVVQAVNVVDKNAKRCKVPQEESKQLAARRKDFETTAKSIDVKLRAGYHKPGSQNRNK